MMFEKMRDTWTKAVQPIVVRLGDLDPSVLTWASLVISLAAFYLLAIASLDSTGYGDFLDHTSMMIIGAVILVLLAGVFDALDGALARHQGTDGPYGDFLDHTIDRIVDVGLLIAIGYNAAFVIDPMAGYAAALLTLLGSYMGTQAQSVGLGRLYGGFSRADRLVITLAGLLWAAYQAGTGGAGIDVSGIHQYAECALLGNTEFNGMTLALAVSFWGGIYTFLVRFAETRKRLLSD